MKKKQPVNNNSARNSGTIEVQLMSSGTSFQVNFLAKAPLINFHSTAPQMNYNNVEISMVASWGQTIRAVHAVSRSK